MDNAAPANENAQPTSTKYISRVLNLIHEAGSVVELRCLKTHWGTIAGYFNDFEKLAQSAAELSGTVPAVYTTLNPVNPSLLARANNRIQQYAKTTSSDKDIIKRCWFPIDFDPVRPTDISSTNDEKTLALARAKECRAWLITLGFPAAVFADSGNGGHLLYRMDLPNDEAARTLIQQCLEALAARFTDDKVAVDLKNFNAARIWKLYGTVARKGDNMPDRPYRLAKIIDAKNLGIVSVELLQKLASFAPQPEKHQSSSNGHYQPFNLDDFIARHSIAIKREKPVSYGRLLILEACPFNPDHTTAKRILPILPAAHTPSPASTIAARSRDGRISASYLSLITKNHDEVNRAPNSTPTLTTIMVRLIPTPSRAAALSITARPKTP